MAVAERAESDLRELLAVPAELSRAVHAGRRDRAVCRRSAEPCAGGRDRRLRQHRPLVRARNPRGAPLRVRGDRRRRGGLALHDRARSRRRSGRRRARPTCTTRRTRPSAASSFPTSRTPAPCRSSRTCPPASCRARSTWRDSALIYAGAQKNIGPSGITVVIVRDDLLRRRARGHAVGPRLPRRGRGRLDAQHAADVRLVRGGPRVPVAQARGRARRDGAAQPGQGARCSMRRSMPPASIRIQSRRTADPG